MIEHHAFNPDTDAGRAAEPSDIEVAFDCKQIRPLSQRPAFYAMVRRLDRQPLSRVKLQ